MINGKKIKKNSHQMMHNQKLNSIFVLLMKGTIKIQLSTRRMMKATI